MNAIVNVNEFYSDHYMESMLADDIKPVLVRFQKQADRANAGLPEGSDARIRPVHEELQSHKKHWANSHSGERDWKHWHRDLLSTLGYCPEYTQVTILPQGAVEEYPLMGMLNIFDEAGHPLLCAFGLPDKEDDPLGVIEPTSAKTWEKLLDELFAQDLAPRWALLLHRDQLLLLDRNKWFERRWLVFDFEQLFGGDNKRERCITAALLHKDSLCPSTGAGLPDELDEKSRKNAVEVSASLREAIRQCVELLGNEYIYYCRLKNRTAFDEDAVGQAGELSLECVRFMYRLLFCFYLEARPELGYLPMNSEDYAAGYSLERLRELEQAPLETEREQNGYFFDASLRQLFRLFWEGRHVALTGTTLDHDFEVPELRSHLFDPERTPRLSSIRFRNSVLQQVIRRLSLGTHGSGKKQRMGRVSYASLGISQLGAVYESLLSYSGFFAQTKLWEVKPAGEAYDPSQHAFFVTEQELAEYTEEERATDENGAYVTHDKGEFIYRQAGSERSDSASYYTPEPLTRLCVRQALQERLKDMKADDLLQLSICEMAVGSASFLNETVSQLAQEYLTRKQQETGQRIPQEEFAQELQRVKMYIADRNVTGVDLNATAVELAEISLWLNSIFPNALVPWFGNQILHGNSLVGARRHSWPADQLRTSAAAARKPLRPAGPPTPYDWQADTRKGSVYHWLVPDEGMAPGGGKIADALFPEQAAKVKQWRKEFCRSFSSADLTFLTGLSDAADNLWQEHGRLMRQCAAVTTDELQVWPAPMPDRRTTAAVKGNATTTAEKDARLQQMIKNPSSPYSRLKLAMDYWCALWFWPTDRADLLPTREDFLWEMHRILSAGGAMLPTLLTQGELDLSGAPGLAPTPEQGELSFAHINTDELVRESPRLALVRRLAQEQAFFHWELECDPIFRTRGGFDLIVGNPPWVKMEWEEGSLLGDYNPLFVLRKLSASRLTQLREQEMERHPGLRTRYVHRATAIEGGKSFLNAEALYPLLKGQQPNLYKVFITRAWELENPHGITALIHEDGIYDSPKGGLLRRELYHHLRAHFQFENELLLFSDVGGPAKYSANIYSAYRDEIDFIHLSNLFHPRTVQECLDGLNAPPPLQPAEGIKNAEGKWSVAGHPDRVIRITAQELALFARLYDEPGTAPEEARLPHVHTRGLLEIMEKIADYPRPIAALKGRIFSSVLWDETGAQKDGTIKRNTQFPSTPELQVLSGPHFLVGNPHYQTPRAICNTKGAYDLLDLETLPDEYQPRVNYAPACEREEYRRRAPVLPWDSEQNYLDCYKLAFRAMLASTNERTMIAALICAGTAHINGVRSLTTANTVDMLAIASMVMSLTGDFYIKTTGATNLHTRWMVLPLLDPDPALILRVLVLNCLTRGYAPLWREQWQEAFREQCWYGDDPLLPQDFWQQLSPEWQRSCALRQAFARRWALCELDVLTARQLGMTPEELCDAYRIQFPVLKQNEDDTWYDRHGRIVFTCSKGLSGVGLSRAEFEPIKDKQEGFTVTKEWTDDTQPGGAVTRSLTYEAPFTRRDREEDYKTIWRALDEQAR